jgi:hypothetical protein
MDSSYQMYYWNQCGGGRGKGQNIRSGLSTQLSTPSRRTEIRIRPKRKRRLNPNRRIRWGNLISTKQERSVWRGHAPRSNTRICISRLNGG